jgi:16S rRNA (uracil1498-N3)-methyltransferase
MKRARVEQVAAVGARVRVPAEVAHHMRGVLRVEEGEVVEVFDGRGGRARGKWAGVAEVVIEEWLPDGMSGRRVVVASAVPKGDRADWMVEKLTEVGVAVWVPLRTARSVVHPEGAGKTGRWDRIAKEAARQCGRASDLEIRPLTEVGKLEVAGGLVLSTREGCEALSAAVNGGSGEVLLLVGPEGGWAEDEEWQLMERGARAVRLTPTILRVETAAVLAAGIVGCL